MVEILGLLARRHQDRVMGDPGFAETIAQLGKAMPGDSLVGNDYYLAPAQQRLDLAAGAFDQPRPNKNFIGTIAQLDPQPLDLVGHFSFSVCGGSVASGQAARAAMARVTVNSGEPSPLSIVTSASA